MFTDIVGSMELTRSLDTERWGVVLDRFLGIACQAIHGLEGTVNQFHGDGLMAVFGAPVAHEDHARRACIAILELQRETILFSEELRYADGVEFAIRCGLNSGEVIVGAIGDDLHMDFAPIGNTSAMGKRMEALAPEGSAAMTAATAALVEGEFELRELGEFEVKGAGEPQRVFELVGRTDARSHLEGTARARGLSRFVGRAAERGRLELALEQALRGDGQAIAICGEPGVGKSRLTRVFVGECRERGVVVNCASAVAHSRAVPLLPVLAMFRDYFGIGERADPAEARERIEGTLAELDVSFEEELSLLFDFLGVPDPERPVESIDPEARERRLLGLVTQIIEARSRWEPSVLVVEDLHWIDEASDSFLTQAVSAVKGARTLLVTTFRPEYPAEWLEDPARQMIGLAPLDRDDAGELLQVLLGDHPSLDGLAEAIQGSTGGNPFFIEEVVQGLVETGQLAGDRGGYRLMKPLAELALPPTVQAVLSARIDRLGEREKALVQLMAVIGKEVPEPVLPEVSDLDQDELAEAIGLLRAAEFLLEAGDSGHRVLAFKHPLTQEVAYKSQLSAARARSHLAVADAIERVYPDELDERAALIAHHAEEAGEPAMAARWYARAAAWVSVSAPAEGMRHWQRVRQLTEEAEASPEVRLLGAYARIAILALAWRAGMSNEETAAVYAEGERVLAGEGQDGDCAERVLLDAAYAADEYLAGREREALERVRPACRMAVRIGDPGLVLNANGYAAMASWPMGAFRDSVDFADEAISLAGDQLTAGAGLVLINPYAHCLWARAASEGCLGMLDRAWGDFDRSLELAREFGDWECEVYAHITRALLRSEVGEEDAGLADAERGVESAERLGNNLALVFAYWVASRLRSECGDFAGGERAAERALEIVRGRGAGVAWTPHCLSSLSVALSGLGQRAEACAAAEEAIEIAARHSMKHIHAFAQLALARALFAADRPFRARAAEQALKRGLAISAELGYLSLQPAIHREFAALARVRGDEADAGRGEAEAERILAEIEAPGGAHATP
jgi:class 3 adenylate cyclase/tetratricopeptide (TPR) repeat protein